MIKKISVITLLIILVNIFAQCMTVGAESMISTEEAFCLENNFFNKEGYNAEKIVSRGEFAGILAEIAGLEVIVVEQDKWSGFVYEGEVEAKDGTIFKDVDVSHPYYSAIKAVVDAGYMKGISENIFAPDVNLTLKQAYTIFLDMVNYEKYAQLEGGYAKLAGSLGITKGISVGDNEYVTFKELARVINNMLDVESHNYYVNEGETFMSDILKMDMVKGFLTDNGCTSLDGPSELNGDYIRVGDVVAEISQSAEYMRDYIGQKVRLYYSYDEDYNVAEYIVADSSTEAYTFTGDDFVDYTGSAVKYKKDGKIKNISLSKIQYMIYNNQSLGVFDKNTFTFDSGEITVIPESLDGKSIIIIKAVEYAYVSAVDAQKQEIYNKIKNFDAVLDLDNYEKVRITSETGEEKSVSDILAGNVLEIVRNSKQINIIIASRSEKNFYINRVSDSEIDTQTVFGDNKSYVVSKQYFNLSDEDKIKLGVDKFYDLYLNSKNEIVWIEMRTGDFQVGYLISSYTDENTFETGMTICDMEGRVNSYSADEKFVINDTKGVRHQKMKSSEIKSLLTGVNDLVRFKLNKDGLVSYIELPMDTLPDVDDRLYKIVDADDTSKWGGTRYPYQRGGVGFGGIVGTVSSVKVLKVPNSADIGDYKKYKKTTLAESFVGKNNSRRFIAYTTKRNAFAAEYLIAKSYENESVELKDTRDFLVVKEISTAILDEDDNVGKKITGFIVYGTKSDVAKKEITLYCDEESYAVINSMPDLYHSKDEAGNENKYELQSGDIIRLSYDESSYIEMAELVFRPTLTNPAFPSGAKGALAGSIGYYDAASEYSNPIVLDENGALKKGMARYIVGTNFRLAMSWVNARVEDVYQVTTQDLSSEMFDLDGDGGRYMVDVINASATSMILIEYEDGKVAQIRAATAQDIKSYEEVGDDCSRIIHNWYWGTGLHGFVINGL